MSKGTSYIPMLPMATLLAMSVDVLLGYGKEAVETTGKAKALNENTKASFPALGKVVAALKKKFNEEAAGNSLISTMTFPEFFKMKTGGKVNNHAESCGKAFGAYVSNGLIAESDYDACAGDWLEKASSIVTEAKGDLFHTAVLDAAAVLKKRDKDGAKALAAILERLKGPKEISGEKAKTMIAALIKAGYLETMIHSAGAEFAHETDLAKLERYFGAMNIAMDLCGTIEQQDAWMKAQDKASAPVKMQSEETPVAQAA